MHAAVVALLALAGCGDDAPYCNPPRAPQYDCTPVPLGTPNTCSGGPTQPQVGGPYDPDKAFSIGCHVVLPICGPTHPTAQTCDCVEGGWECPV